MDFSELAVGPDPQLPAEAFAARRQRVADELGDGAALVVPTHALALHANDVEHRFRPHSDFWYLTGFAEPGATLVLEGGTGKSHLFLRPREPEAEIWTGRRLGVDRARDVLGLDQASAESDLVHHLKDLAASHELHVIVHHRADVAEMVANAAGAYQDGTPLLAQVRAVKEPAEIALLRKAAEVGMQAFRDALPQARAGNHEFHVESELLRTFRAAGSTGPGYPPIVGAGANAAILHYIDNTAPIRKNDLVLVDAGCEWGYYNSDITRTVAADGEWTGLQSELYDLVERAQQAARAAVKPGNLFLQPHRDASRVLAEGLIDRGYLTGEVDAVLEAQEHRRFFMHGTSHFLGLDVHDSRVPGSRQDMRDRVLEPGMVLTIEPGLYFNPDYTTCPPEAVGIGIRIENDVVVTDDGCEDLNLALPTERDAVTQLVLGQ